jgi:hypothetical protein
MYWQPTWKLYIVDQQPTQWKKDHYSQFATYIEAPYNSGLSFCRNLGVEQARKDGCTHILISADSIAFNGTMVNCVEMVTLLDMFDMVGMGLDNRIEWEAKLKLIPGEHFELDFIDKSKPDIEIGEFKAFNCDICRNFFIAKAEIFDTVRWDEDLLLGEHEHFAYQCQQSGIMVGWSPNCSGTYIGIQTGDYAKMRRKNFHAGIKKMKEKLGINGWAVYQNLQRIKS